MSDGEELALFLSGVGMSEDEFKDLLQAQAAGKHHVVKQVIDELSDRLGKTHGRSGPINALYKIDEVFYDDMSGQELDPELVKCARSEEMVEVKKHKVYVKVPISQCWDRTGKRPIGTRCVDVNKGDEVHPYISAG